ncbi:MAG TPA: alpha/beta fold hydrolase [Kofleriaceae bacterium]|jgi:pimeloyl-ACP methyl ester carboxylesterase|nr:alpha/beta fold hydrolase [Kofleriaceae bacterium]
MSFATAADGTRLAYQVLGSGPALLLVAGQASDHHIWTGVREAFASQYRVVTFDHRGTGDSDKPEAPPYSTRGFADDAIAVLDHLGIDRAHAYGMSMGGRIGQWLGVAYPERIGALILGCTTPGNAHGVRRPPHIDPILSSGDPERMLPYLASLEWAAANRGFLAEREAWAVAHLVPPHARRLHYLASEGHDTWELLPRITAPTLVIHGGADEINVTANAPLLAQRIPGAELHIIPGARHVYFWDHGEEANRVVRAFLDRHPL